MRGYLVLLTVFAAIHCSLSFYSTNDNKNLLQSYISRRQQLNELTERFEAVCPGKGEELEEVLAQVKECADDIDENTETMCSAIKNHFIRCSKPAVTLLESCAPEEAKDIPKFISQVLVSGVNYMCKSDGEHIFELTNVCVKKSDYRSMRCERRLRSKLQQYQKKLPNKSELCAMFVSLKPCLHDHLVRSCGNAITRESFEGLFDAMVVPCNGTSTNEVEHLNEVEVEVFSDNGL